MTSLYHRLMSADVVCSDCGNKYGKYSVGCSSVWEGTCDVCGETKGVTEVRDYGYLTKGLKELGAKTRPFSELTKDFTPERKAKIKEQSAEVAKYMKESEELENLALEALDELYRENSGGMKRLADIEKADREEETASYEQGELTLKLTKDEVGFLNQCLDTIVENHETICPGHACEDPVDIALFEGIERKITDLYADECVTYELSPALKAYYEKYGEYGTGEYEQRWEGFRDAYNMKFGGDK